MPDGALACALAAYALGIAATDAGLRAAPGVLACIAAALGVAALASAKRRRARLAMGVGLALLVVLGALRLEVRLASADADRSLVSFAPDGSHAVRYVEAQVESRQARTWGLEVVLDALQESGSSSRVPRRALLRLSRDDAAVRADRLLLPGARVRAGLRFAPFEGTRNPGSSDRGAAWRRRGVSAQARLLDPAWIFAVDAAEGRPSAAARERLLERVDAASPQRPGAGLARALVFGDRSRLDGSTVEAFRRLGLAHALAISGLHVGLCGGMVSLAGFAVLRRAKLQGAAPGTIRLVAIGLGALAAWGYAATAGNGPAVQRAALLFSLAPAAAMLRRDLSFGRALLVVAFVLLALEPAWLFDLGARLSFSACAAIALAMRPSRPSEPPRPPRASLREWGEASLRTTLAASFGTAFWLSGAGLPLSPWAPATNGLAIPALACVVLPASFAAMLAAAASTAAGPRPLGTGLATLADRLLVPVGGFESAIVVAAGALADPRQAAPALSGATVAAACGLGLVLLRRRRWISALALWVGVASVGGLPATGPGERLSVPRAVYLDVGQGDSVLLQGRDAAVLVDTGGQLPGAAGMGRVTRALRSLGVTRLDVLVLSHGDADHRAGAEGLVDTFRPEALWLPLLSGPADPRLDAVADYAEQAGVRVRRLFAGDVLDVGDLAFDVLWPPGTGEGAGVESGGRPPVGNEASLVLRAEVGGVRHLLAADVGGDSERRIRMRRDPGADVLKVGHHGSAGGTTAAFVAAVDPALAVVTAPCRPRRGLPNPETLARLQAAGVPLAWTGRDGAVSVARALGRRVGAAGRGVDFVGWGPPRRCPGDPGRVRATNGR